MRPLGALAKMEQAQTDAGDQDRDQRGPKRRQRIILNGHGKRTASMPMKCMDQIPPPSAIAALAICGFRSAGARLRSPLARRRPVNEARIATRTDGRHQHPIITDDKHARD